MNKVKPSKQFLFVFLTGLLFFIILYPLIYNGLIKKYTFINHSYKDFLLQYTNGSRLIIEGGSNSAYGLNSLLLEKELKILTINLADNGAYPLREKLYRLKKFLHKDDIILLPLEWTYYFSEDDESKYFLENLFFKLNFYYKELPINIKLELIFNTYFSSLMKAGIEKLKVQNFNEYSQFFDYEQRFKNNDRGDYKIKLLVNEKNRSNCNEYIFRQQYRGIIYQGDIFLKKNFFISESFKKNMLLIKELQKKGVHFIFTWPVVAGDDCYQDEYATVFIKFVKDIKTYLKQQNMIIVGEPEDSRFQGEFIYDTHYHVLPIARDNRTKKLIANVKKSVSIVWFKRINKQYELTMTLKKLNASVPGFQVLLEGEIVKFNSTIILKNNVYLTMGWYPKENWGLWSQGNESVLYVKLATNLLQQNLKLVIENNLYGTQDKTTVLINDKKLGNYLLEGKKSLIIPKQFLANNDGLVKIQFNHFNVKSPLEYGLSQDARKVRFGLKSLQFLRVKNEKSWLVYQNNQVHKTLYE